MKVINREEGVGGQVVICKQRESKVALLYQYLVPHSSDLHVTREKARVGEKALSGESAHWFGLVGMVRKC